MDEQFRYNKPILGNMEKGVKFWEESDIFNLFILWKTYFQNMHKHDQIYTKSAWEQAVWPWCSMVTSCLLRMRVQALFHRQWNATEWACMQCDRRIHEDIMITHFSYHAQLVNYSLPEIPYLVLYQVLVFFSPPNVCSEKWNRVRIKRMRYQRSNLKGG